MAANLSKLPNVTPGGIKVLSLLERVNRPERQMADVRAPQRIAYSGVVSSTPSDTNSSVAAASAPNVSNTFCGTRPNDTSTNAYTKSGLTATT